MATLTGGGDHQREATGQDPRDEHAADSAGAVAEGVDDLELGVRDGGLDDGVDVRAVRERDHVVELSGEVAGRGVTRWASNGLVPPIQPCSSRTTPTQRSGVGLPVISVRRAGP